MLVHISFLLEKKFFSIYFLCVLVLFALEELKEKSETSFV